MRFIKGAILLSLVSALSACATVEQQPVQISAPVSDQVLQAAAQAQAIPAAPRLKRRIAVGRFSNATNYGRALLRPGERDPMESQVSDMLIARLVDTQHFIVLERSDLASVEREQNVSSQNNELVGVDTLIVGSLTQFGRRNEGQAGFLSSTHRQAVDAAIDMRLVDVNTGVAFFSTQGRGSSMTEAGEVAGFGSRAGYDATLNDKAISAAIDNLINNIITELSERPWSTDVLSVRPNQVFIAAGERAGLRVGDRFTVLKRGERVTSPTTGAVIELPGEAIAEVEVVSLFGESEFTEGAVTQVLSGSIPSDLETTDLIVKE